MDAVFARVLDRIERATAGLTFEELKRPAPGSWSVAQILEHLALSYGGTAQAVEKSLASGETRAPAPKPREWLARTIVIGLGYFPKVRAPEPAVPRGMPPEELRDALRSAIARLDETLSLAAVRFGTDTRVAKHPYFAGLTVAQWRKFHERHTDHHLRQVRERVRR